MVYQAAKYLVDHAWPHKRQPHKQHQ